MRYEKIEHARSIAIAIRARRQQQQETVEGKLLSNERGLTELRKMVNDWKGDKISLQKLERVVLMKEKECDKTRKLVAEARDMWGSTTLRKKTVTWQKPVTRRVAAHCA